MKKIEIFCLNVIHDNDQANFIVSSKIIAVFGKKTSILVLKRQKENDTANFFIYRKAKLVLKRLLR